MCGIYQIRNIINNKVYIGCTRQNFRHRKNNHLRNLRYDVHDNPHLQASFNKHGEGSFVFEILEECLEEKLDELERKYFYAVPEELRYNCKIPNYNRFGGKLSNETKKKMSKTRKGRVLSKETKRRMSKAQRGKKLSKETKKKLSEINRGKNHPRCKAVRQIDIKTGKTINTFYSVRSAAFAIGSPKSEGDISRVANKNNSRKMCQGFAWEYVEDG